MYLPQVIGTKKYSDNRGWFSETYHENRLRKIGISCAFVQENQSYSARAGTLRGLHFQSPPVAQAKLVSVLRGRVLDVAIDLRAGSPTYSKHVSVELSAESGQQFFVPVGFAHGFLTLEDSVTVSYKVSDYYAPAQEGGICWNDPDIALTWPISDGDIILSDKDRQLPFLKNLVSPFVYDGHPLGGLLTASIN
jgi:dTDP-4-dehydrorhamnose 3,5-epimerase